MEILFGVSIFYAYLCNKINKMDVRIYSSSIINVINYCNDNDKFPPFSNEINSINYSEDYVDVNLSLLEQICKWCENEKICDKLDKYDDFYHKFKRIIDDINFERKSIFDLYN